MNNDIALNKIQLIQRCIKRVKEEYAGNPDNLNDFTKQDAIVLNILRACEASIDLAMHIISEKSLELPQYSRDAFEILHRNGIIDKEMENKFKAMVGFRNIAVHDYQSINLIIVKGIIENHLEDFNQFSDIVLKL